MPATQQEVRTTAADAQFLANPQVLSWGLIAESVALAALVCVGVFFLQWRYGFNWADEGWLWYGSQRTALGQISIRDFFSYDPGRYYWSALFFKLLRGNGLYEQIAANMAFGALGLATIYFVMMKSRIARTWRLAVLLLLGLVVGFPRHKTYEQALSLICVAGIAFLMARPAARLRWLAYGVLTGVAAFIGRNSGLYFAAAGLLLILLLKTVRVEFVPSRALLFGSCGVLIGYSPMLFMLCFVHGFAAAFYQSILFSPHWQLGLPIPFPWRVHLKGLPQIDALQVRAVSILCLAAPATYLISIWAWVKKPCDPMLKLACAASLAGLPFLHHAFDRADFSHIAQSVAPFVIAAAACSVHLSQEKQRGWFFAAFGAMTLLVLACWLPMEPLVQHLRTEAHNPGSIQQIEIDGKSFEVPRDQADVMTAVSAAFQRCGPANGRFFAAPYYPGLYAFLHTRAPVWETYLIWPRSDELQQQEISSVQRNNTALFLLNRSVTIDGQPALRLPDTNPKLVSYILTHYQPSTVKLPGTFELYYSPQQCNRAP
jgi:hypothetical protein